MTEETEAADSAPEGVSDSTQLLDCPVCDGYGGIRFQRCCGRGHNGECCGEPNIDVEPCHACGGEGNVQPNNAEEHF